MITPILVHPIHPTSLGNGHGPFHYLARLSKTDVLFCLSLDLRTYEGLTMEAGHILLTILFSELN